MKQVGTGNAMIGNWGRDFVQSRKEKMRYICRMLGHMYTSEYRAFKKSKEKRRIIMLDTPEHGNLGDHAIVYVQRLFLEEHMQQPVIFEFTHADWYYMRSRLASEMRRDDVIILPGGGFIGTLWEREQDVLVDIMETLADHPIFIFPQTVFFSRDFKGKQALFRFRTAVERCKNLTIFARDEMSYTFLKNEIGMREDTCYLVPDMVTYYQPMLHVEREKRILQVLRKDREQVVSEAFSKSLSKCLSSGRFRDYILVDESTVLDCNVSKHEREQRLHQKLSEFSRSALVITDRLHGMLFAAITGTPCIALDNVSKKVSEQYAWVKHLPYIRQVKAEEISKDLVEEMLALKNQSYSNEVLKRYYQQMGEIIMRKGKGEVSDG